MNQIHTLQASIAIGLSSILHQRLLSCRFQIFCEFSYFREVKTGWFYSSPECRISPLHQPLMESPLEPKSLFALPLGAWSSMASIKVIHRGFETSTSGARTRNRSDLNNQRMSSELPERPASRNLDTPPHVL